MQNKEISLHNTEFCLKSHPIIARLAKETEKKGSLRSNPTLQLLDELEILKEECQQACQCKRAMTVLLEAKTLKKWLRLLFAQHENKFNKCGMPLPSQYEIIKYQIDNLIRGLECKMLLVTHENQSSASQRGKDRLQRRLISKRNRRRSRASKVKLEPEMEEEEEGEPITLKIEESHN